MSNVAVHGANMPQVILRLPTIKAQLGCSRSTIYLRIDQGLWPRQVSLGARAVGWPANEVAALIAARIAGMTNADIRVLVGQLEAARKVALRDATSHLES